MLNFAVPLVVTYGTMTKMMIDVSIIIINDMNPVIEVESIPNAITLRCYLPETTLE